MNNLAPFVPDDGDPSAPIILIGEAPGTRESQELRPFVGPSGQQLRAWWVEAGLDRGHFYLTNVYPYQPPRNDLHAVAKKDLLSWASRLLGRLPLSPGKIIVPTGNIALRAVLGEPLFSPLSSKIGNLRGSIIPFRSMAVIPTIHPAATFREPLLARRCQLDWLRIGAFFRGEIKGPPERRLITQPTWEDIESFHRQCEADPECPLAIDLETNGGDQVLCVGFSLNAVEALVIPTVVGAGGWPGWDELRNAWGWIRAIAETPNPKVLHNGLFDTWHLRRRGVHVRNWKWDTLALSHAIRPREEHNLAYLTSIHTLEPYYKDEGKDPGKGRIPPLTKLLPYNGKDACVTREILLPLIREVEGKEGPGLHFYRDHYHALFQPALEAMLHGIRVDRALWAKMHLDYTARMIEIQETLSRMAGRPLHGKGNGLANTRVERWLTTDLGARPVRSRKTKKGTTLDEVALRRLYMEAGEGPRKDGIALILEHRRKAKLRDFLDPRLLDRDGRFRFSYKFTPENGRLASGPAPHGRGANIQNRDREVRHTFLPDHGCIFLEADLSQVESRLVYILSRDEKAVEIARMRPEEFDVHRWNASVIFRVPESDVTKEQRHLGKIVTHGAQRGLRGTTMADYVIRMTEGEVVKSPAECDTMIRAYLDANPGIERYFYLIRCTLMQERRLVNSWGRIWDVGSDRFSDDLYRKAYGWLPPSEKAGLLNQHGWIPLYQEAKRRGWKAHVHAQVHDSLLISVRPEEVWDVAHFLYERLTITRGYTIGSGLPPIDLSVPVEFKIGDTWKGTFEWKTLPPKEEMTEKALSLARD